jgi:hypothetical protein
MVMFDSVFFRSRVSDPARIGPFAELIAERLDAAGTSRDFSRWMASFSRCVERGLPRVGVAPVDDNLAAFAGLVAEAATRRGIHSPEMVRTFWEQGNRLYRTISTDTLREWLDVANDASNDFDREYMLEEINERGSRSACDCCGEMFFDDELERAHGDEFVCERCRDRSYQYSERYGEWVHDEYAREALNERGRRCIIHCDDEAFNYDEDEDEYVHQDYESPSRSIIRDYHASKRSQVPISDDWTVAANRHLGVELEVECTGARDRTTIAAGIHEAVNGGVYGHRMFFERDGSLADGFEMISQPMSLPALREVFSFLRRPELVAGIRSHRTSTCGLHVHVSRTGLSNLTIARAVTFVNDPGNDAFVTAIARRYNTGFCRYVEKVVETAHLPGDRYEAVNLTNVNTIEFRIFRGSLKYEAVVAAMEFCHALLEFCARESTTASGLNARAFLAFCAASMSDETATMRRYVSERTAGLFQHSEAA